MFVGLAAGEEYRNRIERRQKIVLHTLCGVLGTFLGGFCGDAVGSPDPAVQSWWAAAKGEVAAEWSFLNLKRLVLGDAGPGEVAGAGPGESGPKSSARRRRE